ncbi:uncharacterized protein G2W53_023628 [Senna tora]|uniref:Uncharacterized protein n=1 Tax=Senna tora TaxID=362788 RepID=A0A834T9V4_9FABA|nr:uncharacterized protein G2W53_023628 [Senna tora]
MEAADTTTSFVRVSESKICGYA